MVKDDNFKSESTSNALKRLEFRSDIAEIIKNQVIGKSDDPRYENTKLSLLNDTNLNLSMV